MLFKGKAPYHIYKFFKSLSAELSKEVSSKEIRLISDFFTVMLKQKQTEEKKADKTGKNKSKAQLKGGNSKGYDAMQTNKILENDLIGDDGYGEEDDSKPFRREEEAEFDFM